MIAPLFEILKDTMLTTLIALTFYKIYKGGDDRWHRLLFIAILLSL